jgi:two-component system, NtrC family, sensor histidine kinase PilS
MRSRLQTLIAARVIVGTLLLGSAILIQVNRPGALPLDPFFFLIGLTYALSVVYLATLGLAERHAWLVDLQFGADAVLVCAFIHVTGGVTSLFASLILLPIIAASTVRFRRGALQVAALSAMLYLAIVAIQYLDWGVMPSHVASGFGRTGGVVELPTVRFAQYTVGIHLFGFFAVALLAGSLAEGLRSAGARLEDASNQIDDLRAFNEHVIDSLLSGLATLHDDGRIRTFNRAASLITGVPSPQAVGRDVGDVLQLPPDVRSSLPGLADAQSLRVDVEYRHDSGRRLDVGLTATRLAFPDGRRGHLIAFQDVTNVRRLEREARLRQRLAAVGEMAAGIAHEIRNPLAAMSGSIQVLRQELSLTDEQAQLMDIVLRESERLNDTIRSFLAYAGPQRSTATRLDLATIVRDTALLLRNSAEAREGHVIHVTVPPGPVWYEADENHIRQILWNLATNGLRAMAAGGTLELSVEAPDAEAGDVVLAVRDEGRGIPAEDMDGIFQPFRSSFEKGTGLGLAIVHRIVSDYNGSVQVTSTVGEGTTVSVRMPGEGGGGRGGEEGLSRAKGLVPGPALPPLPSPLPPSVSA